MEATQQQIAETLAGQAAERREKINSVAPDEGAALALFASAATASLWAAEACEDVTHLDAIIDQGYFVMIAASRNSARLFPPDPDLLETMTFTAWCHLERFEYRLDFFDLDEAHRYASDALKLAEDKPKPSDPLAIRAESVIARVASRRFEFGGNRRLLEDAVERLERCISLQPDVTAMVALATALRRRAEVSDREQGLEDLKHAAALLENILNPENGLSRIIAYPVLRAGWLAELGLVHFTAARLFESATELADARDLCRAAVEEWPTSPSIRVALAQVEDTEEAYLAVLRLQNKKRIWAALQAAEGLTWIGVRSGISQNVVRPSKFAWELLQQIIDNQIEDTEKKLWLPRLNRIIAAAVPAHAENGHVEQAVDLVENIRTRVLQEKFPDEERELFELAASGHQELSAPIRQNLTLLRGMEGTAQSRTRAKDELVRLIGRVRELPGFSAFRTNPGAKEISAALQGPAVYLVPGEPAGSALVVLPNGRAPISIALPACPSTPPSVVTQFLHSSFDGTLPAGARRAAIDAISTWAWDALYQPLRSVLAGQVYVHVIGTSYLALVPFHAARMREGDAWLYAAQEVEVRYSPSGRALMAAQKRQVPEIEPRFMVIPQPLGGGADLDGARSEVTQVASYFPSPLVLPPEEITASGIREAIGSAGWLHAACHGTADAEDPLASGLVLAHGERFSLRDLFEANEGHLLLTVLSACQTNVPDLQLPDEATSLAAGLLLGGCRAVIASAWQVPDSATAVLMRLFYRQWRQERDGISSALRNAQLAFAAGRIPSGEPWKREWSEPYFWAGFSYLGP